MKNGIKILSTLAIATAMVGLASATTCVVPSGGYSSITWALADGGCDTISVDSSYSSNELLVIDRAVVLSGNNGATLNGGWVEWTIISIKSSDVTIEGFNITNIKGFGISTKENGEGALTNIVIKNNTITNIQHIGMIRPTGVAIYVGYMSGDFVYSGGTELLNDNLVAEIDYDGLIVSGNTISNVADAISIQSVHGATGSELKITNNSINGTTAWRNGAGVWIDSSSHIDVDGNTVSDSYYGINVTSYVYNKPRVEYNTAGGSHHINITNNNFNNAKSANRYDGAGVAIYGGQTDTITISGNDLSNNARYAVLLAANDNLDAGFNYIADDSITVLAKSYINATWTSFNTAGATISTSPYYFTADHARNITGEVITGDNDATLNFTLTEILSNSTFTAGILTITGVNTSDVQTTAVTGNAGAMWFDVSHQFTSLDVDTYNYEMIYTTSEGTGSLTGSFEIPLVAYGCRDMTPSPSYKPYIWFNTNISNIDMLAPTDEAVPPMSQLGSWRLYNSPTASGNNFTFHYEKLGSTDPQTYVIQYNSQTCN